MKHSSRMLDPDRDFGLTESAPLRFGAVRKNTPLFYILWLLFLLTISAAARAQAPNADESPILSKILDLGGLSPEERQQLVNCIQKYQDRLTTEDIAEINRFVTVRAKQPKWLSFLPLDARMIITGAMVGLPVGLIVPPTAKLIGRLVPQLSRLTALAGPAIPLGAAAAIVTAGAVMAQDFAHANTSAVEYIYRTSGCALAFTSALARTEEKLESRGLSRIQNKDCGPGFDDLHDSNIGPLSGPKEMNENGN